MVYFFCLLFSWNSIDGFPIIRIRDLKFNKIQTYYSEKFPEEFIVDNGDLLVGMDGDFICYEWGGGKAVLNQRVCKLIPNEKFILKKFLYYSINVYLSAIQNVTSSVTVKHLSSLDILKIPFPITSISEQERIVSKLNASMENIAQNKIRLEEINSQFDRLKQNILAKAFRGELVPQNPNDETANVLLERIKQEKENNLAEKKGKKSKEYSIEEKPLRVAAEGKVKYKKIKV